MGTALLVSAPASGQGKTAVTAALARLYRRAGRCVRALKVGPDFIDPTVLAVATGAPVAQLDLWMGGEADCRRRLARAAAEANVVLVEGVMGLHDGDPPTAELARRLGLPVLLVIDAQAMAGTFGAVALGLASYRPGLEVAGVLANRVAGPAHAGMLRRSLPPGLPWMGALMRCPEAVLPERHLGLVLAGEVADLAARLDRLADLLAGTPAAVPPAYPVAAVSEDVPPPPLLAGRRIAVARDAAFAFLYPANLELLQALGAEILFFSPLADEPVPEADAVWLPGGYPELHLERLAAAARTRASLRAHHAAGRAVLAECGGFLYLLESLAHDGRAMAMAGMLPGRAEVGRGLAAIGYQEVDLGHGPLRGHTFHHARADVALAPAARARDPSGRPGEAVYRLGALTAGFVHFYFPSNPRAAAALFGGGE